VKQGRYSVLKQKRETIFRRSLAFVPLTQPPSNSLKETLIQQSILSNDGDLSLARSGAINDMHRENQIA